MNTRSLPIVTTIIIILNVFIYVWGFATPSGAVFNSIGSVSASKLAMGEYWTLFSSMFIHGGLAHILCNMISLYYLGSICEKLYGPIKYAIIYLVSGLCGGLVFAGINMITGDPSSAVGASGAIFGLFGTLGITLIAEHKSPCVFASAPPRSEVNSIIGLLAFNLVLGVAMPGIAVTAHLGGLIGGLSISTIFYMGLRKKYRKMRDSSWKIV